MGSTHALPCAFGNRSPFDHDLLHPLISPPHFRFSLVMDYSSRAPSPSDLEKQAHLSGKTNNSRTNVSVLARESSAASSSVGSKFDRSVCQPIRRFEEKCGMESRGIERVKEEDCHEASAWGS